ncbi:tetratricopeptide repeat protein [uncultured Psychroserpens sp.]|uniref:tetratricopeptide repeat protein n=1 Tax=uncultured Psychroserpens sp. TaxID=255436 RepID=UPI0026349992|nr:tetratricopeptide repeat protein [uncultured Psychroserpens sp.]
MKKQIVVALALLVSTFSFSQKNELKTAEKAIKSGNFADAKAAIKSAEALIANADDKLKAKFYFLKGQALYANGNGSNADMPEVIESFEMVKKIEAGKGKYSSSIDGMKTNMINALVNRGYESNKEKRYASSADDYNMAYRISPKDTIYLYYAATSAIQGQDYDTSLKYYEELRSLRYNGKETKYIATNKETGKEEVFDNVTLRDASVKTGSHIAPKEKNTDSKLPLITKMIAEIYVFKKDPEKAMEAVKLARKENPNDLSLILTEADIHLKSGNTPEFKKSIQEAIRLDPDNAELQFNLGVIALDAGEVEDAKTYYKKSIALDPDYAPAYRNLAVAILSKETALIEEMNGLGMSAADDKRYEELKKEHKSLQAEALPLLEKTFTMEPNDLNLAIKLLEIHRALENTDKINEYKEKVNMLKAEN